MTMTPEIKDVNDKVLRLVELRNALRVLGETGIIGPYGDDDIKASLETELRSLDDDLNSYVSRVSYEREAAEERRWR